jgi:hypothetical protein
MLTDSDVIRRKTYCVERVHRGLSGKKDCQEQTPVRKSMREKIKTNQTPKMPVSNNASPKRPVMQSSEYKLVFPDCAEGQVDPSLGSAHTPALARVTFAKGGATAARIGRLEARSAILAAIFTVSSRLESRNAILLDSLVFGVRTVRDGVER